MDRVRAEGLDAATERKVAVDLFNHTWTLLDRADRTREEDNEMLHAAHASRYHWIAVGTSVNAARGEWQVSRVYAVLGRGEPALWHARRALEYCEQAGDDAEDWDLPVCFEGLARAHAVACEWEESQQWLARGREAATSIAGEEDRELVLADLATVPLPGSRRFRSPVTSDASGRVSGEQSVWLKAL
jgi:hypothetical protein